MTVLISGCSSGIGLDTALFLKQKGYDVIATARDEHVIHYLEEQGVRAIKLDVNSSSSIHEAVAQATIMAEDGIDVLINNAGFGQAGALEDLSREILRDQFETNVFGLYELTNTILPYMLEQQRGRIINISSVLGFVCLPFRGAYCASKYAVEALSDTWRLELHNTPIKVSLIEPGPIESHFRQTCIEKTIEAVDMDKSRFQASYQRMLEEQKQQKPLPFGKPGTAVSETILKAMTARKPKPRYRVTVPCHFLAFLKHLLTSSQLEWFIRRVSQKELK